MPSRPARPAPGTGARLTVERLGDRIVPTVTNPKAAELPAAVVGTALPPDLTLAKFESADPATSLSATVAINGGTPIAVTVVPTGTANEGVPEYAVRLPANTYTPTAAGPLGFAVTISDKTDNTSAKVSARADVKAAPLVVVSTNSAITPTEGATFTSPLAVFKASDPAAAAGDFTVTVDWGDGTTPSAGTVAALGDGKFQVAGTHAYAAPKAYEVKVSVADADGDTLLAKTTTKPVVDAATTPLDVPPLATSVGVPLDDVRVATFTDANPLAAAADYTATVNWGNGTPVAATVVSTGVDAAGAHFAVVADHTYTATLPAGATVAVSVRNTVSSAALTGTGGVTVSTVPIQPVLSNPQQYVRTLYLRELGRSGTDTELNGWVAVMGGANGRSNVANAIARSAEARTRLVAGWYETYLDRTAKDGEAAAWAALMLQGKSEEQALAGILGSQEFYYRAQSLAAFGTPEERRVQALYTTVLGRTASAAEVTPWVGVLPQVGSPAVATAFLSSVEYRARTFDGYYLTILHRPADDAGLTGWVNSPLDSTTVRAAIASVA